MSDIWVILIMIPSQGEGLECVIQEEEEEEEDNNQGNIKHGAEQDLCPWHLVK